ncbi:hypothetical protein ARMSODRAFT_959957 [Armillaria solidipes]|uniref:Uncharacterized protein n=1 Tax=Armillaria solidipes TaxID=1076256 RepID=A0A2H3BD20_9AGAR|nr:hypothetical protein ARMSODRAFT_959957 [Armillaria solidipes]
MASPIPSYAIPCLFSGKITLANSYSRLIQGKHKDSLGIKLAAGLLMVSSLNEVDSENFQKSKLGENTKTYWALVLLSDDESE